MIAAVEPGQCPICIDGIKKDEQILVTSCGHLFHGACLQLAFSKVGRFCPTCRSANTYSLFNATGRVAIPCPEYIQNPAALFPRNENFLERIVALICALANRIFLLVQEAMSLLFEDGILYEGDQ